MTDKQSFNTGGGLEILSSASQKDPLEGQLFGNYRLGSLIAAGGMGRVYQGSRSDGQFDRAVAVKVLPSGLGQEYTQRFEQERMILASLSHPNIAQLYDAGLSDSGSLYLVMELIDGMPIDQYTREHQLNDREKVGLMLSLASTLEFAHSKLVIHRDLKPSNVFVSQSGELKLLDFGIAKILEAPNHVTADSRPMTPQYASPEQLLDQPISVASDIYQLGLLFLSLFEPRSDFKPESLASATERAVKKTSVTARSRLSETLPAELDAIINQCLRADPAERYTSATELTADLINYLAGYPVSARNPGRLQRNLKFLRRNLVAAISTGVAALLVAVTVAFYTHQLADQRDIARSAATQARLETARAEHVSDFLVDLFRATQPDGPADQLPTTADLLDLGAERALDPTTAPAEERLGMLFVIGRVYLEQGRFDQARPLLGAAVQLTREFDPPQPDQLANALTKHAYLDSREGNLLDAETRLKEAQALVDGVDEHLEIWATTVVDRAWVASMDRDNLRAAKILSPLIDLVRTRPEIDPDTKYRALQRLASIHQKLNNLELSAQLRAESEPYLLSVYDVDSLTYAIFVANSSNLEHRIGRFQSGIEMNRRALELYDRIYVGQPVVYRAVGRRNLVRKLITAGQFEQSLEELSASTEELAKVSSLSTEDDPQHHFYYGEMMILMRRWSEAADYILRARALFIESEDPSKSFLRSINTMGAWAVCQDQGSDLDRIPSVARDALMTDPLTMGGTAEARIRAARACIHWREQRLDNALSEIDLALALVDAPGALLERAERMMLRGRIVHSQGDHSAAITQAQDAIALFVSAGLTDHPNSVAARRFRQTLATP